MLSNQLANKSVELLLQYDLTGETVTKYVSVNAAYLWPIAFVCFIVFLMALGLLAKLKYSIWLLRREIKDSEHTLEKIRGETAEAEEKLAAAKSKISEREVKAVDKALSQIDETHDARAESNGKSKEKLWDMMKSEIDDGDSTTSS